MTAEWQTELKHFIGTSGWYQLEGQTISTLTDGTRFLAEKSKSVAPFVVIDEFLATYVKTFLCSNFKFNHEDRTAEINCHDGNYNTQYFTTFREVDYPLDDLEIWTQWSPSMNLWVHMLPSEY